MKGEQTVDDVIEEVAFKRRTYPTKIKACLIGKYEADLQMLQLVEFPTPPVDASASLNAQFDKMDEILHLLDESKELFSTPLSKLTSSKTRRKPVAWDMDSSMSSLRKIYGAQMSQEMANVKVIKSVESDDFSGDSDDQILTGHGVVAPTSNQPKDRVVKRRTSTPLVARQSTGRRDKAASASKKADATPLAKTSSRIPIRSPSRGNVSQYSKQGPQSPSLRSPRRSQASPAVKLHPRSSRTPLRSQGHTKPISKFTASSSVQSESHSAVRKAFGKSPTRMRTSQSASSTESPTAAAFRPRRITVMRTP